MKWNTKFAYPKSTRSLINGSRHYSLDGSSLPSVTTILSATKSEEDKAAILAWKQRVGSVEAERIKKEANINTMAVGAIIEPDQAEDIITNGRADLIAIGRELLADTQWVYKAATKFGLSNSKDFLPDSYSFFLSRRDDYLDRSAKPA